MPQRGRLLDRFLPVLILGALFFLALQQSGSSLWSSASPAVAANGNPANPTESAPADSALTQTAPAQRDR
jgi:hypothetical protein